VSVLLGVKPGTINQSSSFRMAGDIDLDRHAIRGEFSFIMFTPRSAIPSLRLVWRKVEFNNEKNGSSEKRSCGHNTLWKLESASPIRVMPNHHSMFSASCIRGLRKGRR